MKIADKYIELCMIVNDAHKLIKSLQSECPHERGQYRYECTVGNWIDSEDSYWRVNQCDDCGLRSYEYSEEDGVKNLAYAKDPGPFWRQVR